MSRKRLIKDIVRDRVRGGPLGEAAISMFSNYMDGLLYTTKRSTSYFFDEYLHEDEWEDIEEQMKAICGADIDLRMPTSFSYFEVTPRLTVSEYAAGMVDGLMGGLRILVSVMDIKEGDFPAELDISNEIYSKIYIHYLMEATIEGRRTISLIPYVLRIARDTGVVTVTKIYEYETGVEIEGNKAEEAFMAYANPVIAHVVGIMVLSRTKGFPMVTHKGESVQLIARDNPTNARIHVKIGEARRASTKVASIGGVRCKMRLHMRRGHYRTQHWGHRNMRVKIIWIDPVMVGYIEEGEISHDYEIVTHPELVE